MHDQDCTPEIYTAPPPGSRVLAIAAKWANRPCTVNQFNLFSDLSRADSESQLLVNDAALALTRNAAVEQQHDEDEETAREAREIIEWVDSVEAIRKAGAAPNWSPPPGVMTLEQWIESDQQDKEHGS